MENIKKHADGTAELLANDQELLNKVKDEAARAATELLDAANLKAGDILVVGCSTSEVAGHTIGKASIPYANSILERWHAEGYHTVEEIERAIAEYRRQKDGDKSSFNADDFWEAALKRSYGE